MGLTRRTILAAGAAAAATAAVPRVFAQQSGKGGTGKFYERGSVRIYYEEAGSGFPLLLLPGGGLNSTIAFFTGNSPFNAIEEFKGQYRCITADLRNAPSGQSTGPIEVDRPWESYADDQLGLRRCIDTLLEQAMEKSTIPSDVVFAAPSQDERAIESSSKF